MIYGMEKGWRREGNVINDKTDLTIQDPPQTHTHIYISIILHDFRRRKLASFLSNTSVRISSQRRTISLAKSTSRSQLDTTDVRQIYGC